MESQEKGSERLYFDKKERRIMKRGHRTISTPGRELGTKFKENSEKEDMKNRVLTIIE